MILFNFVDLRGRDLFTEWRGTLQSVQRAKLDAKLRMLLNEDPLLFPNFVTDTREKSISELKIGGKVALRPLLCRGPVNMRDEITFLLGAIEKDTVYVPKNALELASAYRNDVLADPDHRRIRNAIST